MTAAIGMDGFDLGSHRRKISTTSPQAQRWFDVGLNWCFAFNKSEALKCFRKALESDPHCVMAHWGVAYACGPFYNLTWREHGEAEAKAATATGFAHIALAREAAAGATALENALVETQARRIQKPHPVPPEEFDRWDDAYADALRRVYADHPDDLDVIALFAEALITRTPRKLWDVRTGLPAENSDVAEALEVCERGIALGGKAGATPHPALLHLHIHALEMSNTPERALPSAQALAPLAPDAGHLDHMPAHVYMLIGDYAGALVASERAIAADNKYLAYAGVLTPYTTACAHDLLLMMHTAMFMGRHGDAMRAADGLCALATRDVLSVPDRPKFTTSLEGYHSMRTHVLVRFGRWHDIIAEPLPDDPVLYPVTTAMQHYAKAIAHATLKQFADADRECAGFHEAVGRIAPGRKVFNNTAHDILGVAETMMDGEVAYHKGEHDTAFAHLREAVRRDDNLEYVEPWAWMHPPRHALGALLAEQGQFDEAEAVYRDDLGLTDRIQRCAQHPDNVWALHGLAECLRVRGALDELAQVQPKLDAALALADVPITSSCLCRVSTTSGGSCCC